jgi:phage terminase small subunit
MAKKKPQPSNAEDIESIRETLDSLNFRNDQAKRVEAMQSGKERVRDRIGRNKERRVSTAGRTSLQTLNSSLGNQFKR